MIRFSKEGLRSNRFLLFAIAILFLGCALIVIGTLGANSGSSRSKTKTESELTEMINDLEGVENASVMLLFDDDGSIGGAAVVCDGGDDAHVRKAITELITSLFGIGPSKVFVGGKS